MPTGGEISASSMFTTTMMHRCSGSTPSSIAAGNRIGMNSRIIGTPSMKTPAAISTRLTSSRNSHCGISIATSQSESAAGTPSCVSMKENRIAMVVIQKIIPIRGVTSRMTRNRPGRLVSR
jgi:hypothetical protein